MSIVSQASPGRDTPDLSAPCRRKASCFAVAGVLVLIATCLSVGLTVNKWNQPKEKLEGPSEAVQAKGFDGSDSEGSLFSSVITNVSISSSSEGGVSSFDANPLDTSSASNSLGGSEDGTSAEELETIETDDDPFEVILPGGVTGLDLLQGGVTSMQGGEADYLNQIQNAIYSTGLGNSTPTCIPRNSTELVQAIDSLTCRVIILTKDREDPYTVRKTLRVVGPKILIGHPARRPVVKAAKGVVRTLHGRYGVILT